MSLSTLNTGLVDTIGKSYVIDHYIAFFKNYQENKAYRIYITDALQAIGENTSKANGGKYMNKRFVNVIEPHIETRTSKDIINDIKHKLSRL